MKYFKIVLCFVVVILTVVAFYSFHWSASDVSDISERKLEDKIKSIMDSMTIDEKIAQMMVIYYENDEVDEELSNILSTVKPGGFILMKKNYTSYEKTRKFVDDIKYASEIPLIVATDQEGGSVQRLQYLKDDGYTDIPYMYDLGKMNDEKLAYEVGKIMALELRTLGINVVFAPVLDVFSNPDNKVIGKRSFSEDKSVVSKMALSVAKGLEDNGVIPTYKHYPGHGDTATDSHSSLPIINKSYDEIFNTELSTFRYAISNGAKLIMTAHIAFPMITGDNTPATMSNVIINDVLRERLDYKGIVISDALNMKALTNNYNEEEIYLGCVNAGVDILLMPKDIRNAVEIIKNNISEDRIDESVYKILKFKYNYLNVDNSLDKSYIGKDEYREVINKIIVSE